MKEKEFDFLPGGRKDAIRQAIEFARKTGGVCELLVCRDIPGEHTGGSDCFCDPKVLVVDHKGKVR